MRWLKRLFSPSAPSITPTENSATPEQRDNATQDDARLRQLARIIQKTLDAENFPWVGELASRKSASREQALFEADAELNAYWLAIIANGSIDEEKRRVRVAHAQEVRELPVTMRRGTCTLGTIQGLIPTYRAWGRLTLDFQAQGAPTEGTRTPTAPTPIPTAPPAPQRQWLTRRSS